MVDPGIGKDDPDHCSLWAARRVVDPGIGKDDPDHCSTLGYTARGGSWYVTLLFCGAEFGIFTKV